MGYHRCTAQMPEWSKGAACKAVIRGFKSRSALYRLQISCFDSLTPSEWYQTHIDAELSNEGGSGSGCRYSHRSGFARASWAVSSVG